MNLYMNKTLAKEKGLIADDSTKKYDELENYYKYLFENYLLTKVNLYFFVDKINKSELGFECPSVEKAISNELPENFAFNYIFNLNNFFIEKLSKEQLDLLSKSYENKLLTSSELTKLIEETYKDVIKDDTKGMENAKIIYGQSTPSNAARNGAIVLKIYYKLVERYEEKDAFIERFKSATNFIKNISEDIHELVERDLKTNCDVLVQMK